MNNIKIAVVHDWFVTIGGAEKVVCQILAVFPDADIFSIVDFVPREKRHLLRYKKAKVSFVQKLPFARRIYRAYLPLMTYAIEQFDLSEYDLIISSSHAVAKGVLTNPNQLHICYCHTPIRYAWYLQHQYLQDSHALYGVGDFILRWIFHKIRIWDLRTSNGVDYFISNSNYIGRRIYKCYRRLSTTIYPNVDTEKFVTNKLLGRQDFYLTASRLVPYKKIDVVVKAFANLPDKKLVVVGDGPDFSKIKALATANVEILGYQEDSVLIELMQTCKAFVFAAEEDFGITPIEAQACGAPVIAFGRGGALETVVDIHESDPTGLFFYQQTEESIINALHDFETNIEKFDSAACVANAQKFSAAIFKSRFLNFVEQKMRQHFPGRFLPLATVDKTIKVSVCILTLNAMTQNAQVFKHTLGILAAANLYRILVIDSASEDNTVSVVEEFGFECKKIRREDFNHGGTRQLGLQMLSDSDYIIYLTQDVLIKDLVAIENLINYTIKNNLAAAYGCQAPHANAQIFARHLRLYNYGERSYVRSLQNQENLGIKLVFASNSFSVYKTSDLLEAGGFPENILMGEDMYAYSTLLLSGRLVGYCADALVWHSHNYSIIQDFKRYFDIGVFHHSFISIIKRFGPPEKEGFKYAKSELLYVLRHKPFYIPSFILHTVAKYAGYKLGLHYKQIGIKWCLKFSMHPKGNFWHILKTNSDIV